MTDYAGKLALERNEYAEEAARLRKRVADLEESLREDVGGVVRTNLAQRKRIQELEAERADVDAMAKEMTRLRAHVAKCVSIALDHAQWAREPGRFNEKERLLVAGVAEAIASEILAVPSNGTAEEK
jgi:hypothetical protein